MIFVPLTVMSLRLVSTFNQRKDTCEWKILSAGRVSILETDGRGTWLFIRCKRSFSEKFLSSGGIFYAWND